MVTLQPEKYIVWIRKYMTISRVDVDEEMRFAGRGCSEILIGSKL
jgi:hypothetical protein